MAVANQFIITIHKPKYQKDFLQIGNDEWIQACNNLTPAGFKLYLYLAGNADGYNEELSKTRFCGLFGVSEKTYQRATEELRDKGYLILRSGSKTRHDFYLTPHTDKNVHVDKNDYETKMSILNGQKCLQDVDKNDYTVQTKMSIEIDNIDNIDNINKTSTSFGGEQEKKEVVIIGGYEFE